MSANPPIQPLPNIEVEPEPPRRQGLPPVAKFVCGAAVSIPLRFYTEPLHSE